MSNNTNETIDYEKYIRLASEDYRADSMNNRADTMRDAADSYAALAERVKKLERVEELNAVVTDYNSALIVVLRSIIDWVDDMGDDFQHDEAWEGIEAEARKQLEATS